MKTYTELREETHEAATGPTDPANTLLPCRRCDAPTRRATLTAYGDRCFACFQSYLVEPQPSVLMGNKAEPKSWAHALKAREDSGEELSIFQQAAWRAVVGENQ